jgi:hypothetical protein
MSERRLVAGAPFVPVGAGRNAPAGFSHCPPRPATGRIPSTDRGSQDTGPVGRGFFWLILGGLLYGVESVS